VGARGAGDQRRHKSNHEDVAQSSVLHLKALISFISPL
jgi:hypothetical protein